MQASPVVLVVDDDSYTRQAVVQALAEEGITGIEAASGQEALRILDRDRSIDLLLTDIMMPGIAGTTLADRASVVRPDVKIMFMTAYAGAVGSGRPLIEKPFGTDALCATIRAMCTPS